MVATGPNVSMTVTVCQYPHLSRRVCVRASSPLPVPIHTPGPTAQDPSGRLARMMPGAAVPDCRHTIRTGGSSLDGLHAAADQSLLVHILSCCALPDLDGGPVCPRPQLPAHSSGPTSGLVIASGPRPASCRRPSSACAHHELLRAARLGRRPPSARAPSSRHTVQDW